MQIVFGLALDDSAFPLPATTTGNLLFLGPKGLLSLLENHLGLSGHSNDNEYLRVEQYRQALRAYLAERPDAFFGRSFAADQFATATELLSRRDELLMAGWDFLPQERAAERLRCLAEIESLFAHSEDHRLDPGIADRYEAVIAQMERRRHPVTALRLVEPPALLSPHLRRLIHTLEKQGVPVEPPTPPTPTSGNTDLTHLQRRLDGATTARRKPQADGSLIVLRAKRETDLADFLARLFRHNPALRPLCLVPDKNRSLDAALIREGLSSLGIRSASLARPTLQALKLVTVFLWNPIDPFKVMEFVSLPVKPLDDELANRIALVMAQSPGINGEQWRRSVTTYFEELEARQNADPSIKASAVKQQYRFWFERGRYDISSTVPKGEVIEIFRYLHQWARRQYENNNNDNPSLAILAEQAKRVRDLLETLPEQRLTNLELERIVRTIYEPAALQFRDRQVGHLPYVHAPHAVTGPVETLAWWNFTQFERDHFFSRWYRDERAHLAESGIHLTGPEAENERLIWQRKQPLMQARKRVLLLIPQYIEGSEVMLHPLYGDLSAAFENLDAITCDLERESDDPLLRQHFRLPEQTDLPRRRLGRPRPFLQLSDSCTLDAREKETFSSLNDLFYYPYKWVFRHKIQLRKSSILSIVNDQTLLGNLAHRFLEKLLKEDVARWTREDVARWIDQQAPDLLQKEGAVLLLYGREPERISFIKRVKFAAWSLLDLIQRNGWSIEATEKPLEGMLENTPLNGRADLLLRKNDQYALIDLKWTGFNRRRQTIQNEEDLQLILYAYLLHDGGQWAHTAYFVMDVGKMVARTNHAFQEIIAVAPEHDHGEANQRIFQRMQATYRWRMDQIRRGQIEIRCAQTQSELEELYGAQLLDLLEMKTEDAPFDDYRVLIDLVE